MLALIGKGCYDNWADSSFSRKRHGQRMCDSQLHIATVSVNDLPVVVFCGCDMIKSLK